MATVELKDLIDQGDVVGDMGFVIFYPHAPFSLTLPLVGLVVDHTYVFSFQVRATFSSDVVLLAGQAVESGTAEAPTVVLTAAVDDEFDGLVKVFATVDVTVNGGDPQPLYQGNAWVGSRGAL